MRIRLTFLALVALAGVIGLRGIGLSCCKPGERSLHLPRRADRRSAVLARPRCSSTSRAATAALSGSWSARARRSRSPSARTPSTCAGHAEYPRSSRAGQPRRRRPADDPHPSSAAAPAAHHGRVDARRRRLGSRAESRPRSEAALALPGHAQRAGFGWPREHPRDGRQLPALKAMLGQALDQSFAYNRRTVFIRWQGRTPT